MNRRPGVVDPDNAVFPFGRFERLHFSRFVVLDDRTSGDLASHGVTVPPPPPWLAFLADFDGPLDEFLEDLVQQAADGLRRIFSHCVDPPTDRDLRRWLA